MAETRTFADHRGTPLAEGDRVVKVGIDHGAPAWATRGEVVGFGRTRIRVRWDSYDYTAAQPHHVTTSWAIRREPDPEPRVCTCGAREYGGCFCNLTPREFVATGGERRI